MTPNDLVVVGVRSSVSGMVLTLGVRVWGPDGQDASGSLQIKPPGDRSLHYYALQMGYGYLVSAALWPTSGPPSRGQVFGALYLAKVPAASFTTYGVLAADYLTAGGQPAWPSGRIVASTDGPGYVYDFAISGPPTGSEWSQGVPSNARWRLRLIVAQLYTSSQAGNRSIELWYDIWSTRRYFNVAGVTQAPSLSVEYTWEAGATGDAAGVTQSTVRLPPNVMLPGGWGFQSNTEGIQNQDSWRDIACQVEEWIDE